MNKRMVALLAGLGVLASGVVARLCVITNGGLSIAAGRQSRYTITTARSRGTIYDTNLTPLVNTGSEYHVSVAPTPEALATMAGQLSAEEWAVLDKRLAAGKPVAMTMNKAPSTAPGIVAFQAPVRYAETLPAAHWLGYVDSEGAHGVSGAERVFDAALNEYAGEATVIYTTDGTGALLSGIAPEIDNTLSRSKGGVALTLDSPVQKIAQRAADRYLPQGTVVVSEAATGRVLAMVSTPGFQPDTVGELLQDKRSPLLNRALCHYNCGSVFKIVSVAAALEAGIPASTTFSCTGRMEVEGVRFHCHHQLGHGALSMMGGFAQSCNPYFIQLAQQMGGDPLCRMASALGFDRTVTLYEGYETDAAVMPSAVPQGAALANFSFGQGDLLATPLHIAQLVGAVVNDGQVRQPTVLKGFVDEKGTLTEAELPQTTTAFSAKTAEALREMMVQTVQTGTGKSARPVTGGAGGKTGTAQTGWKQEGAEVVQSWFAGFYPATEPKYTVVVLAEDADNTGGQSSAAFKQICEQLAALQNMVRLP